MKRPLAAGILLFFMASVATVYSVNKTYQQVLRTGIKPGLKPNYPFPVSKQSAARCYACAIKHIVYHQYKLKIDIPWAEKKIDKHPRALWSGMHIINLMRLYKLKADWHRDPETFFKTLAKGRPVIIQYLYGNVGHFVAVYSFDGKGVWISESLKGKRMRLPYQRFFKKKAGKRFIPSG